MLDVAKPLVTPNGRYEGCFVGTVRASSLCPGSLGGHPYPVEVVYTDKYILGLPGFSWLTPTPVELIGVLPDDLTQNQFALPCPVPSEQLPLNEYQDLQESWFFRWATLETPHYAKKLTWIGFWSWAIAAPVAAASFPLEKYFTQFLLVSTAAAIFLLSLVLLRLYLGWAYISSRLMDSKVVYEESGWYDGQIWNKPTEVLTRDRLVASYQIHPWLKRMRQTFGILLGVLVVEAVIWGFWLM